jgi:hypothetical protein
MSQKAERADPIIYGDEYYAFPSKDLPIIALRGSGAQIKTAAMYPDHHGSSFVLFFGSCPDIEVETIFTLLSKVPSVWFWHLLLWAGVTKVRASLYSLPATHLSGRSPTEISYRRSGIGNAFECIYGFFFTKRDPRNLP